MATQDKEKRRQQWRSWYQRNKQNPIHKNRVRDFDKKRRKKLAVWLEQIKSNLSCCKCGFKHPAALDFHHRDPKQKLYEVSVMPHKSLSKNKILLEIAKCDVLCANCHRILHYELSGVSLDGETPVLETGGGEFNSHTPDLCPVRLSV